MGHGPRPTHRRHVQGRVVGRRHARLDRSRPARTTRQNPSFTPKTSSNNGISLGEGLGLWLRAAGLDGYQAVHLIGHSSGSWLVDALADQLRQLRGVGLQIHLTLLDAFVPPDGILRPGSPSAPVLGETATWADQFFDASPLVPLTSATLPEAFNINVTNMRDGWAGPETAHAWPYVYYDRSVTDRDYAPKGLGFELSKEWTGRLPDHIGFSPEANCGSWLTPPEGRTAHRSGSTGRLRRQVDPKRRTRFALLVHGGLDPERARDVANYSLVKAGRDRRFGTRDDRGHPAPLGGL